MLKWWNKLKNKCKKCKKYLAMELIKETDNFFYWKCKFCGFKRKHERAWGTYWIRNGRTFLKTRRFGKFKEVGLKIKKKSIKVVPINEANEGTDRSNIRIKLGNGQK